MCAAMALFGWKTEAAPLTDTDLTFLRDWSQPYAGMTGALKTEFEEQVAHFVADQRITPIGLEGPIEREDRLLIAASACTLSAGWKGFRWTDVTEILLYADDFDRDYQMGGEEGANEDGQTLSGEAHPWGTVLLSLPSLEESFQDPHDGYHVGYHEFAHVLDRDPPSSVGHHENDEGGLPSNIDGAFARDLSAALKGAREKLQRGESPLDEYALQSSAELWAVAVEAFFETPSAMETAHPELRQLLDLYFNQRPRH
jgi:MtfA peptidase